MQTTKKSSGKSGAASKTKSGLSVSYTRKPPAKVLWSEFVYDAIPLKIAVTEDGAICRVEFTKGGKTHSAAQKRNWQKNWPATKFIRDPAVAKSLTKKMKQGEKLDILMIGTEFQCTVWKNLLAIPEGEVVTYAELARRSKSPKAVRAAGTACGANPVAILVPCHRVIASDGGLGGFGGGLPTKKKLLKAEGFQQFKD